MSSINKFLNGEKLRDSHFRGILNEAVHLRTKGKNDADIHSCIKIMKEKIEKLEQFLESRSK